MLNQIYHLIIAGLIFSVAISQDSTHSTRITSTSESTTTTATTSTTTTTERKTTALPCQNGGTQKSDGECICPYMTFGSQCQYLNNYVDVSPDHMQWSAVGIDDQCKQNDVVPMVNNIKICADTYNTELGYILCMIKPNSNNPIGGFASSSLQSPSDEKALLKGITCTGFEKSLQECRFLYDENNCDGGEPYQCTCRNTVVITCQYNGPGKNCSSNFDCDHGGEVIEWPEVAQPAYKCECQNHWVGLDCSLPNCTSGTPYNDRCIECDDGYCGRFCDRSDANNTFVAVSASKWIMRDQYTVEAINGVNVTINGVSRPLALSQILRTTADALCNAINLTGYIADLNSTIGYDTIDEYWSGDNITSGGVLASNCAENHKTIDLICQAKSKCSESEVACNDGSGLCVENQCACLNAYDGKFCEKHIPLPPLIISFCDKNQNLWLPVTTAIASPISDNDCPPLYVYDPNGNYISLRYSGSNPQEAFKIIVYHYPDESGMTNFTDDFGNGLTSITLRSSVVRLQLVTLNSTAKFSFLIYSQSIPPSTSSTQSVSTTTAKTSNNGSFSTSGTDLTNFSSSATVTATTTKCRCDVDCDGTISSPNSTFRSATYALSAVCAIFFLYSMGTTIWILWNFCYSSRKASTTWSGSETASFPDRLEAANRTGNSTPAHRRQQNQNHNNNVPESAQTVFPNLLNTRPPYLLANTENSDEYAQAKPHPNPGEADDEDKERYEIPGADKFKARPPPLPPHAAKKPVKTNS